MAKSVAEYDDDGVVQGEIVHEPIRPPATTPEGRERQIIAKAYDLVEQQIDAGTVSAQVLAHFVKAGSTREVIDLEYLSAKAELERAKVEQIASEARVEVLYQEAIEAMRTYSGQDTSEEERPYDDGDY